MTAKAKWIVAILTVLFWAIGCCLYCYWYINSILVQPIGDSYARSAGFQFLMFLLLRFPFLLLALFPILYIEAIICNLFFNKKQS
jgi:hypothetical protein